MTQKTPDTDDALAAEYVVGLLPADERAAAHQRLGRDRAFAERVHVWEAYFAGLNKEYGTMSPPARVKTKIDTILFPAPQKQALWPRFLGLGVAAALVLAVLVSVLFLGTGPQALQADLISDSSGYRFALVTEHSGTPLEITLVTGAAPVDQSFELWLLPSDAAPVSLGTFASGVPLQPTANVALQSGSVLAVSLEPIGGSPTGAPTGPVLAVGSLDDA